MPFLYMFNIFIVKFLGKTLKVIIFVSKWIKCEHHGVRAEPNDVLKVYKMSEEVL